MSTITQLFENTTGIKLKEAVLGIDPHTRELSLTAEFENPNSLQTLLSNLGIGSHTIASPPPMSTVTFLYKKAGSKATTGGYSTSCQIEVEAGLHLSDILDDSGALPSSFDPELNKIELYLDLSKVGTNGQEASSTEISFAMYFGNPSASANSGPATSECILKGVNTKTQSNGKTITAFVGAIYSTSGDAININFGSSFPLDLAIKDLYLAKISQAQASGNPQSFTIYGAGIGLTGNFDMGSLPVIGEFLSDAKFSFNSLRFSYSSQPIHATDINVVNSYFTKANIPPIVTAQSSVANSSAVPITFPKGFSLQGTLVMGEDGFIIPLHSNFSNQQTGSGNAAASSASLSPTTSNSSPTSTPVAKQFGPISIESVSLGLSNGDIALRFSGGLKLGPLEMEFIGLKLATPVKTFDPTLSLQGLGVGISKPPLELNGLFMEATVQVPQKDPDGTTKTIQIKAFDGSLSIKYQQYSLSAIGSYARLPDGTITIFLYGFLGAPLGGPPFLFITGVAAGFGYNRAMTLPSAETINTYPLIQPVLPANAGMNTSFDAINLDFIPEEGAFWGAVGIRVESFKMVTSFVMLALRMENDLEIDIIGLSKMQFPIPKNGDTTPPLAKIIIGLIARIIPDRGIVAINGAFLSGSYVFNPMAHISGGFAMLSVFKDQLSGQWKGAKEGDFVLTLGGYATNYTPKTYYPLVPRLELNWQVSSALSVKAQAYFAITPDALMAGGHLSANFQEGGDFSIRVAFDAGADFIINWKPYHYTGNIYVNLAVTASINVDLFLFTIHASVDMDLGASLDIWGPSFSGHATVYIHFLVSFSATVSFGDASETPPPIDWDEFSESFLPEADKIISTNISQGLIASQSSSTFSVVNAKELELICSSALPVKSVSGISGITITKTDFGIKPMANEVGDFSVSDLSISMRKNDDLLTNEELNQYFNFEPITKNMPTALWEPAITSGVIPESSGDNLKGLTSGIKISAKKPQPQGHGFVIISSTIAADDVIDMPSASKVTTNPYASGFSLSS